MMATEPMGGSYGGGQDILSEATNSIVLPMTAEGVQSMQYNPNMNSTSIVEMGKQLLAASRDGLTEDVSQLLARSAPMTTDWLGTSPLHLAASNGHCSTAEVLMRSGCSRDAKTKVDKTPLHLSATEGHSEMTELLLKSGAEVDSKDMLRMTPLHWAVERGHADCAEVLIRYGADVNFENKFGKCPLELASEHGRSDMYEMLQNADDIRAAHPVSPPSTSQAPINPMISDPVTMAATQSIQSELNLLAGESGLMSPPGAGSSGRQRLLSSSSLLAGEQFITGASPPPSTDHLASQEEAMKFLEGHGITLLPEDTGGTSHMMESVISSGRQTLTLTEAGKLALSSSAPSSPIVTTGVEAPTFTVTTSADAFTPTVTTTPVVPETILPTTGVPTPTTVTSIQAVKPSFSTAVTVTGATSATGKVIAVAPKPALQTTKSIVINTSNPNQPQTIKTTTFPAGGSAVQPAAAALQPARKEPGAPRVIRVTPEQFAAIKAGKGARLTGLGVGAAAGTSAAATISAASNKPALARTVTKTLAPAPPGPVKTVQPNQRTIKIVRLNPSGSGTNNVQLLPKPVILSSPRTTVPTAVTSGIVVGGAAPPKIGSPSAAASAPEQAVMEKLKEIQDAKEALQRKEDEMLRTMGLLN